MTHRYIKIGATSRVLVLALTGLMWSTLREGTEYFKHVDEVMANPQAVGRQAAAAARLRRARLDRLKNPTRSNTSSRSRTIRPARTTGRIVDASYTGIVPDTFKDEAEVVLKGHLTADGFQTAPNGVIAKCPSKYEAGQANRPDCRGIWLHSDRFSCSPRSSSAATRRWCPWSARARRSRRADRERHRRLLPRHGADGGGLGRHDQRVPHRRFLDQVRRPLLRQRAAALLQDHRRTGAGSTARSCSGCSCSRSSGRARST